MNTHRHRGILMLRTTAICLSLVSCAASAAPPKGSGYSVVYSFQGGKDGADPHGGLIALDGLLYGTTYGGGVSGTGTVFSLDPKSGAETTLHSFGGTGDGQYPHGSLLNVGGTLYGTTSSGGQTNHGAVFSFNPSTGTEKIVYSFAGTATDGGNPLGSLINVGGVLYGTTQWGGSSNCGGGCGTVFSFDPSTGTETVLYIFQSGSDGAWPQSGLLNVGGLLYGTTQIGGAGYGTIFSIKRKKGRETIEYAFAGSPDGAYPPASLIKAGASLYSTTNQGGKYGLGAIIATGTTPGSEKLLASFEGGPSDGQYPQGSLINVSGVLYGTTSGGGAKACTDDCGTVFALNLTSNAKQILYFFQGGKDGGVPYGNLVKLGDKLYGTTTQGGGAAACNSGCGTVFAIKP